MGNVVGVESTNEPRSPEKIEWVSNLSGFCEEKSLCCCALMCPALMIGGISEQYGEGFSLATLPCSHVFLRSEMRERYNIKGSLCGDWFAGLCCGPCTVVQLAKEVNKRHPY